MAETRTNGERYCRISRSFSQRRRDSRDRTANALWLHENRSFCE